jgi:replicative DNA helicase
VEPTVNELYIIKLFIKNKDLFQTYSKDVKNIIFEKEIQTLFSCIAEYYVRFTEHGYIGKAEFLSFFEIMYSNIKDKSLYYELIEKVFSLEVSDSLIKDYVLKLLEKDYANRIITKLMPVLEEDRSNILSSIEEDLINFKACLQQSAASTSIFVEDDIEALIESEITAPGLEWRLKVLNDSLGHLRGGTLGHIFARPETGKTTFLCSELTHFARQLNPEDCIIWFNNEEKGRKVKLRMFNSVLGADTATILADTERAREVFLKRNGDKLKLYDNAFISIEHISQICDLYKPRIVVVDQGDKVSFSGDKKYEITDRLKELYRRFREIPKQFNCDLITVGQASSDAHGKKWLQDIWMDYSKTGKPGEMDYIIGIGKTCDEEDSDLRYLNIPKNKLTGRHDHHVVCIDTARCRYRDMD